MNKKVIALVALVFAVVVTGFSVSGTYAKYISEASFSDYGRVAKWDIDFATSANFSQSVDLFKQSYTGVSASEDVVAPGAYGSYTFTLAASGTPEVNYKVDAAVTVKDNIGKLKFAVVNTSTSKALVSDNSTGYKDDEGADFVAGTFANYKLSADDVVNVLEYLLLGAKETTTKDFNAGQQISLKAGSYAIHWMWDFNDEADAKNETNVTDTELGNGKTNGTGHYQKDYHTTVSDDHENKAAAYVSVKLTATQKNS